MNILAFNFIFFICFFPLWIFAFKVTFTIKSLFLVVLLFFLILHNYLLRLFETKKLYFYIYLSFIFTFGVDNALSLYSDFILQTFQVKPSVLLNNYILGALFFIIIWIIIFFLLKKLNNDGVKIISTFILSILLFNFFFSEKLIRNFPDFNFSNQSEKKYNSTQLIFILDQMAGINSEASNLENGKLFDKLIKNFSQEHKAKIYKKVFSNCKMTFHSIPLMINFNTNKDCEESLKFSKPSNNFFNRDTIIKNKLFDNFNSISIYQNYFLNFCDHKNVVKCDQFSQFKKNIYIKDLNNLFLSQVIGGWKHYGSISANIVWRICLELNLIVSLEQSSVEKISLKDRLNLIEKDLISKKYDLILFHTLSSHEPYGFTESCDFDNLKFIKYRSYNYKQKLDAHNLDRICVIKFIDNFFKKIKDKNIYNNLNFIIVSDHGTRLKSLDNDALNVIFVAKDPGSFYQEISEKKYMQNEFSKYFKNNYKISD